MNNQKGITLVELLAAMVLLFLVSTLVLSIATQAIENYRQTETRSFAQQEANLFINQLASVHRTADFYEVKRDDSSQYTITTEGEKTLLVSSSPFQLDVTLAGRSLSSGDSVQINSTAQPSIPLHITIVSQADQRFKTFEIDTNLYRLAPANDN